MNETTDIMMPLKSCNDVTNNSSFAPTGVTINPATTSFVGQDDQLQKDLATLKKVNVFEIFPNRKLARMNVNYTLYFQFFNSAIWIFIGLYIFYFIFLYYYPICSIVFESFCHEEYFGNQSLILILFGGILLRLLSLYQEKKLLANRDLQNIQCTEDLFSLFLEDLPHHQTQQELEEELNSILQYSGVHGNIVEMIRIQDFYAYTQQKTRLTKIHESLSQSRISLAERVHLQKEKLQLEASFSKLEDSLLRFEQYKHKAILILSTFEAKEAIKQHLHVPWWNVRKYFSQRITVGRITEPQDVIFENLCYPKFSGFMRKITANLIGVPLALGITYAIFQIKQHEIQELADCKEDSETTHVASLISSVANYVVIHILFHIMETIYKRTYHNIIYTSVMEAKMSHQYFVIYTKTMLYVLLQFFFVQYFTSCVAWPLQMTTTTVLIILESFTIKLFKMLFNRGMTEFDTIEEISTVIPLIFFGFTFPYTVPETMLPFIIGSLYLMTLIDKKRLTQHSKPLSIKSPNPLLRLFAFFRVDHYCILYGGIITAIYINSLDSYAIHAHITIDEDHDFLILAIFAVIESFLAIIFILIPLIRRRDTLRGENEQRYVQKNFTKTYESEFPNFTATYKTMDPYYQLKQKRAQKDGSLL